MLGNTKNIHLVFQGDQSWLAEAGCGHPNSLGCGGRQDFEPQRRPGARRQGFQEVEGAAGLDRGPDIWNWPLVEGDVMISVVMVVFKVQFPELF